MLQRLNRTTVTLKRTDYAADADINMLPSRRPYMLSGRHY
jgi:hypothetical protein